MISQFVDILPSVWNAVVTGINSILLLSVFFSIVYVINGRIMVRYIFCFDFPAHMLVI